MALRALLLVLVCTARAAAAPSREVAAIEALKLAPKKDPASKAQLKAWVRQARTRQIGGERLGVMDHTALLHLARSLDASDEERGLAHDALVQSWRDLTGKARAIGEVLDARLPGSAMGDASQRERAFHAAAIRDLRPPGKISATLKRAAMVLPLVGAGAAHVAGVPGADMAAGLFAGYTISSLEEYLTHRFMLHAPKLQSFWRRVGLRNAFFIHSGVHHGMFGSRRYSTATNEEWSSAVRTSDGDPVIEKRDALAARHGITPETLHSNLYGMSMNADEVRTASLAAIGTASVTGATLGLGVVGTGAAIALAPLTAQTTKRMHPFLHMPVDDAMRAAGPLMRRVMKTPYWRLVSQLHYQHHLSPTEQNFSLFLPGPDHLFGTLRRPSVQGLIQMDEMGLAY
jgi:hypothetical protein